MMYAGFRIIEAPYLTRQPRMQLSEKCAAIMRPEDVARENKWLLEFFGWYMPYYVMGDTVIMHPSSIAELKASSLRKERHEVRLVAAKATVEAK